MRRINKIALYIVIIFYSILTFIPLWYVVNNAFKKKEFIIANPYFLTSESFTFNSIVRAFNNMKYPQSLMNNIVILVFTCALLIILGSLAGYSVVMSGSKLLKRYYIFSVMIITIPFQIVMVPLTSMMRSMNLVNTYAGVSLVFTAFSMPFVIFLYTGYMKTLPKELAEAAIVDGCGMFKTYLYIYMPLLQVVTGTVLVLRGVTVWNDLLIPLVTISKSGMLPLSLKLYSYASQRLSSWDLIFAGTFLVSLPITLLFLALQRVFIQGVAAGAVKG